MKYILVTGVSGGIGSATAKNLIDKGYYVIGTDIKENDFSNEHFAFIKCNLLDKDEIIKLKENIEKITPKLFAILNVAGIFLMQSMLEGKEEDLRKIIDINFFAVYSLNKAMFPLLENGSKIIILTSEVARYSPQPFDGYYALSKVILDKYADILRRELNYLKIKVIKVQSGAVKTGLLLGVNAKYQEMVDNSVYYKKPLTKLKKLMDNEINKQVEPSIIAKKLTRIVGKNKPKMLYKIKNSFALRFLNFLPEKLQDFIYLKVIK